jgi:hypothetical protein
VRESFNEQFSSREVMLVLSFGVSFLSFVFNTVIASVLCLAEFSKCSLNCFL